MMNSPAIVTGYGPRLTIDLGAITRNWQALDKVSAGALTGAGALIGRNRPSQSTRLACVLHPATSAAMTAARTSANFALILGMAITRTSVCSGADASRAPCGRR